MASKIGPSAKQLDRGQDLRRVEADRGRGSQRYLGELNCAHLAPLFSKSLGVPNMGVYFWRRGRIEQLADERDGRQIVCTEVGYDNVHNVKGQTLKTGHGGKLSQPPTVKSIILPKWAVITRHGPFEPGETEAPNLQRGEDLATETKHARETSDRLKSTPNNGQVTCRSPLCSFAPFISDSRLCRIHLALADSGQHCWFLCFSTTLKALISPFISHIPLRRPLTVGHLPPCPATAPLAPNDNRARRPKTPAGSRPKMTLNYSSTCSSSRVLCASQPRRNASQWPTD